MNILLGKRVIFVVHYTSECGGNIISLLDKYAEYLIGEYDCNVYWIFPKHNPSQWLKDLQKKYIVAFTTDPFGIIPKEQTIKELCCLFEEWQPDIVHSHFEQYDISVSKAVKILNNNIKVIYHIHDAMSFEVHGKKFPIIRYIRRRIWYMLRYYYWGKKAYFISVSPEMAFFTNYIRKHPLSRPTKFKADKFSALELNNVSVVINGIVENRLNKSIVTKKKNSVFSFLSFGTTYKSKGIDTLLAASELLHKSDRKFQVIITKGNHLDYYLNQRYGNNYPQWLKVIPQTENVATLFESVDCYISASRAETMSMAIAEATFMDLPVIQSNIPGTDWNAKNPSTFLFNVENASELCEQMQRVMDIDEQELSALCKITEQNNREELSVDKWIARVSDIYIKVLNGK